MNIYHHHTIRFLDVSSNTGDSAHDASSFEVQGTSSKRPAFEGLMSLLHLAVMFAGPYLLDRASNQSRSGQKSTALARDIAKPDERSDTSLAKPMDNAISMLFSEAAAAEKLEHKDGSADAKPSLMETFLAVFRDDPTLA
jgi:hypothetical protein